MNEVAEESDRISELPDSLIHVILSLLPMRDVVSTSLLSKRWKNLWTTLPYLNFCNLITGRYYAEDAEVVRDFVNRALIFWRGIRLLKFELDTYCDDTLFDDMDLWVRFAVENKVEELNIHLMCEEMIWDLKDSKKYAYKTPSCLYSCSSIKQLSLVGCILRVPVSPPWVQLKSLKLDGFGFSERLINRVLLGCPQLEVFELRLMESYENLNIRSTSLKKLIIEKYLFRGYPSTDKMLRIHCPNLETLVLAGALYPKYVFKNVSSLTDVTLDFDSPYYHVCDDKLLEETLKEIFSTFLHVDKVALSYPCAQVLGELQNKHLQKFLSNVKVLVIKEEKTDYSYEFEPQLSKSFMLQLKTIDITTKSCSSATFRFIECLLRYASKLENLVIRVNKSVRMDWFEVAERLLCLQRSFPIPKVILKRY